MSLINASLPLLVGQASIAQHTGHGDQTLAEVQQSVAQAQSVEELLKARKQIEKTPPQEGAPAVNDQGSQGGQANPRSRRRRRKKDTTQEAVAVADRAADPLDRHIVDMDI